MTYPHSMGYNMASVDFLSCGSLWRTQSLSVSGPHLGLSLYTEDSPAKNGHKNVKEKVKLSKNRRGISSSFFLTFCSFNYMHIHTKIYVTYDHKKSNVHFISQSGFHLIKHSQLNLKLN